ncbi:hypothetical protein ABZY83_15830 [Streptomyces virginiae]|uniref:nSTAND1 domain-containing NTPase n=1 Tax=Streptomyces virginiae TaxID=1961 RepID=UPI0033B926E9
MRLLVWIEIERAGLPGARTDGISTAVFQGLAAEPGRQRILLVIDQFEELFTHAADGHGTVDGGRINPSAVADQIVAAVDSHTGLSVILAMRDDFYPQLAALAPGLLAAATPGLLNVSGALSDRDLDDIITLPAGDVGLRFQPGLPERIVSDVLAVTPEEAATRQAPATVLPLWSCAAVESRAPRARRSHQEDLPVRQPRPHPGRSDGVPAGPIGRPRVPLRRGVRGSAAGSPHPPPGQARSGTSPAAGASGGPPRTPHRIRGCQLRTPAADPPQVLVSPRGQVASRRTATPSPGVSPR